MGSSDEADVVSFNQALTHYQALTQQWVHAQQVRWTLLSNFLVASSILLLAWASVYNQVSGPKSFITIIFCVVGLVKCYLWWGLSKRGNAFVQMYDSLGKQTELLLPPRLPRPFWESDELRKTLNEPGKHRKKGAGVAVWKVFNTFPWIFGGLYVIMLVFSMISTIPSLANCLSGLLTSQ